MGNQDVAYRKSENSERIRLIFELDRDIYVTMLCKKFEGCEAIISGVIVLTAGRPDILTDFRVYFLSTQKHSQLVQKFNSFKLSQCYLFWCVNTFPSHLSLKNNFMTVA